MNAGQNPRAVDKHVETFAKNGFHRSKLRVLASDNRTSITFKQHSARTGRTVFSQRSAAVVPSGVDNRHKVSRVCTHPL